MERRLGRWEAALGDQPPAPEKSALVSTAAAEVAAVLHAYCVAQRLSHASLGPLVRFQNTRCCVCRCALPLQEFPFQGFSLFGPPPPPPGARRRAGATAGPERCAARLQAAGVLTLLDAALACLQAQLPPPAAQRGARDVPPDPSALEGAGFAVLRRLEDTGLPYPVRPAAGSDAAQAGQATAAGIRALGACCSALTRLLRLAGRRYHAQPRGRKPQSEDISAEGVAATGQGSESEGVAAAGQGRAVQEAAAGQGRAAQEAAAGQGRAAQEAAAQGSESDSDFKAQGYESPLAKVQAQCLPVQLDTVMDVLFDAAAVLTFWAPRQGKAPGAQAASSPAGLIGSHCWWCALGSLCSQPYCVLPRAVATATAFWASGSSCLLGLLWYRQVQ